MVTGNDLREVLATEAEKKESSWQSLQKLVTTLNARDAKKRGKKRGADKEGAEGKNVERKKGSTIR